VAAVTEAMYLLGSSAEAQDALWDMLETRAVLLATLDLADVPACGVDAKVP